ncbi:MAG: cupin domain-containing protein [Deltaproteobacteria bacterium]|nr:cupin domain-containing protein [Deltaproteobacteria bacterium]MBW2015309.1 cupin domain-containing protein [Deltaproteobacteria bacterium]MBW2127843.1 cupin domain-containing protein [Deltaproteobacteria bacterium]MBW2302127.1 cupin domain-containing protein [Deltaproteobacteria bacterium]
MSAKKNGSDTKKMKPGVNIGSAIRARRRQLNLTLKEVGEKAGLSVGFLSQLERNLATPSLSSLVSIANAIDVGLEYFLTTPQTTGLVARAENRNFFSIDGSPVRYARLSNDLPNCRINGVMTIVPPGWDSEVVSHEGEDFAFVISGVLYIKVGDEEYTLTEGDAIHFDATIPHKYGNPTDQECVCLNVGTQPLFAKVHRASGESDKVEED